MSRLFFNSRFMAATKGWAAARRYVLRGLLLAAMRRLA